MADTIDDRIDELWNFADPAESEARFRDALADPSLAPADEAALATQLARSLGLQRRFDAAHAVLDALEDVTSLGAHARVRFLLERGRVYNSAGAPERARGLFDEAWELARASQLDGLAVDAAHMIAIAGGDRDAITWNERALALAETSSDPRARRWRGSLLNNLGWAYHDRGEFDAALELFDRALLFRREGGSEAAVRIARWCVARVYRSLGRLDEALAEQTALASERGGERDGFVEEELGELELLLGRPGAAHVHLAAAAELLAADPWIAEREPERVARLQRLAGQTAPDAVIQSPPL